jgi:hypothetical protein
VRAAMPVPQGVVEVEYQRSADGWDARVNLPDGAHGEFLWKGRATVLHAGTQTVRLPW